MLSSYDDEQFDFLLKYFGTFSATDPELGQAKERVKQLLVDLIKDPQMARIDNILAFPVVKQLKDDPNYAKVHQLLEIVAKHGYEQYFQLYQQDPTYFENQGREPNDGVISHCSFAGLAHSDCSAKVRLLSLLSLGATKDKISYAEASKLMGM